MTEDGGRGLRLSVIMPVYNEAATVESSVERVARVPLELEIVCVDDGSTDGTTEILRRLEEGGGIDRLIVQERNGGKGSAVRTGIRAATGDVIVIQDADLEYDPLELPTLLEPIADGRADAVFGSRFLGGPHRVLYFWHRVGNGLLTLLSNMLTDLNLSDMETCYKMARADLMKSLPLRARRFGIEPELTARLAQARARIYELPISYSGRTYDEGKKIGWRDGLAAFWHILRFNLLPPRAPVYQPAVAAGHGDARSRRTEPGTWPDSGDGAGDRRAAAGPTASGGAAGDRTASEPAREPAEPSPSAEHGDGSVPAGIAAVPPSEHHERRADPEAADGGAEADAAGEPAPESQPRTGTGAEPG